MVLLRAELEKPRGEVVRAVRVAQRDVVPRAEPRAVALEPHTEAPGGDVALLHRRDLRQLRVLQTAMQHLKSLAIALVGVIPGPQAATDLGTSQSRRLIRVRGAVVQLAPPAHEHVEADAGGPQRPK